MNRSERKDSSKSLTAVQLSHFGLDIKFRREEEAEEEISSGKKRCGGGGGVWVSLLGLSRPTAGQFKAACTTAGKPLPRLCYGEGIKGDTGSSSSY